MSLFCRTPGRWPPAGTGPLLWLTLAVASVIVCVQLLPFDFQVKGPAGLLALTCSGPIALLGQVALFVPLGVEEGQLTRRILVRPQVLGLLVVTVDTAFLALICETAQLWLVSRSSSVIDLCANMIGGVVGYLLVATWMGR